MNFTSQICTTKEQSERLLALGLKKETADMFYPTISEDEHTIRACWKDFWGSRKAIDGYIRKRCIPAWSLHRLIELMPTYIDVVGDEWTLNIIQGKLIAYTTDEKNDFLVAQGAKSLYDSIIYTIEWLIQAGHFNKEYLEGL